MSNFEQLDDLGEEPTVSGVATAKVTDNEDPEGVGRVKVTYPFRESDDESHWARIATEMASKEYGTFFLPEVGDEVLVAFEGGNIHHPVVIGSLYNGKRKPPFDNASGDNDIRAIKSRNEHTMEFDDATTGGKVTIETAAGHTITLDDTAGAETITVEDSTGDNSMTMDSVGGEVTVSADKKITLDADTIKLDGNKVDISAKNKASVSGNSGIDISSKANLKMTSNGNMKVKGTGMLTLKGALVKIN
ncbi:MAG: phage baseplate assembly protein V [Haloarculaceae archaeon]